MYKMLTIKDKIRVPPIKFDLGLENAIKSSLEDKWEGTIMKDIGVSLSVDSIKEIGEGKILAGDGAIHYPVAFQLLSFEPEMHEIVKGHVIDVTEFGVFIRMGPLDGMIHVSQLMDDFVSYESKRGVFVGRDTKNTLKEGDSVKARVISVSVSGKEYKIGLTTRQHGLGGIDWKDRKSIRDEKVAKMKKTEAKK
ncbi:MAG: DNA-directed RNA polymerase [Nanoarchaeota archaeon]|nr:DNA-directed RNA polymerase [Nanoarchaeota archaeon]MBU1135161.1 DNA-directed RNA polymerase [Nanoarchaeota archaeon]MBU2520233.1 DNA-directed RNA polymerase [Nanoarchaeota archaeon]